MTRVYPRDETYQDRGELEIGPDIIVGTAKGTRISGHSALGAVGKEALTDNLDDWSGDHLMDSRRRFPGILLTNRPLAKPAARLRDLAAIGAGGVRNRRADSTRERRKTEMFGGNVKLDKDLLARVKKYSDIAGYSSVEEFIAHALEKELAKLEDAGSEEEIKKRLKGLGYIS